MRYQRTYEIPALQRYRHARDTKSLEIPPLAALVYVLSPEVILTPIKRKKKKKKSKKKNFQTKL